MDDAADMGPRVLVVDDDPTTLMILSAALDERGFEVETLDQGFGLASMMSEFRPRLVLLDINMPGLSGDVALEAVTRDDPELRRDTRVLLHSALPHNQLARLSGRLHAQGFIEKPATPEQVAGRVAECLHVRASG